MMDQVQLIQSKMSSLNNFHQQFQQQHQQQLAVAAQQQVESIEANKGYTFEEQFKQLYELSDDPKRKEFLDDLFQFMADRNQPVNRIPIMAKQVLDLYELYNLVVARGGLVEVINKKIWREITRGLNLPSSITSAAFTLRTQYMKYLYPYECAKNNFSQQDELQQAIDGNRREGRRAGATGLVNYGPYINAAGALGAGGPNDSGQLGQYSASPSPNHLFTNHNNLLSQVQQQLPAHQQHQPLSLHQDLHRDQQQSGSSNASPSANFNHQRRYQDSIQSDHDDEASIDLSHSPKRNSPIDQHLDSHNQHLHQQQPASDQQQQFAAAAAAAAALRQQIGVAMNFAGAQNLFCQLAGQLPQVGPNNGALNTAALQAAAAAAAASAGNNPAPPNGNGPVNGTTTNNQSGGGITNNGGDLLKQQQEQFLAALMAAASQQQQQTQQQQQQPPPPPQPQPTNQANATTNPDQQAAARAALSMIGSNAMIISAPNAADAVAISTAAQAIGAKGAFIILLL